MLQRRVKIIPNDLPSERKFGLFFALIFFGASVFFAWRSEVHAAAALIALAVLFIALTVAAPGLLAVPNRLWFELGGLLGKIVNPVVLGVIFFFLITPIAIISRVRGRDILCLKKRTVDSYWVARTPPGPEPQSFNNQF